MAAKAVIPYCPVSEAMMALHELKELGNARNAKMDVLNEHAGNEVLQELFRLTYDWETTFGISAPKKLPEPHRDGPGFRNAEEEWQVFQALCEKLAKRLLKGNAARKALDDFLSKCVAPQNEWFRRCIDRDLKVRITASSIQKIWPGVIKQFKVQLAKSLDDCKKKVTFPVAIEPKYDGMRAIIVVSDGQASAYSRVGHELPNVQFIADYIAKRTHENCVIDGELFGTSWNDTLKYVKTTKNLTAEKREYLLENVKFYAFDFLTLDEFYGGECKKPYWHKRNLCRRNKLVEWYESACKNESPVCLVPVEFAETFEEIDVLYDKFLLAGYEGIMVKQLAATYKGKRTDGWLKYKPFVSIDCIITDVLPGKVNTRLENTLGRISVEYEGVAFNVGSGFSDEQRDAFWTTKEDLIGRYVEVKVNKDFGLKESKVNFPVFMRMRPDKDE